MPEPSKAQQKRALRRQIRADRRSLSQRQQAIAAKNLARRIATSPIYRNSKRIAIYLAQDGEINLEHLVARAYRDGKQLFLPVLHPLHPRLLLFAHTTSDTPLVQNRYGIPEPDTLISQCVKAQTLDLVLIPLVAFDDNARRMGMGGGFYDTSFAFKTRSNRSKPALIGVAHELQRVDALPVEEWDVPLQAVMTDRSCYSAE